jgi:DNA end-binding protein Ku
MATTKAKAARPRASANFVVGFGLVGVPMAMKPIADSGRSVSGKYVCPQHGPNLSQRYLCSEGTPQEHLLESGGQVTAFEHPDKPGEYVVVERQAIEQIAEQRSGDVNVEKIVDVETIDPIFYDKTYLCWAQKGGEVAFELFAAILREEGRAAVATVVISKQTVTLVIRWSETAKTLVAHTCRFESQMRWGDVELVTNDELEPDEKHYEAAKALMATLVDEWSPGEVVDLYTPMLQEAIRASAKGVTFEMPEETGAAAPVDLMAALSASVEAAKKPAPKKRAPAKKKAPRKRTTKAKA